MATSDYEPRIIHPSPGEEIWVQSKAADLFEVGVQLNQDQWTYLDSLTRYQLEAFRDNINAALAET